MKKLIGSLLVGLLIWICTPAIAVPGSYTAPAIQVSAEVDAILQLTITIYDGINTSAPVVTSMNFGSLVLNQSNFTYASSHEFTVTVTALTSGRKYTVSQTGTQLTDSSGDKMPTGAQIVTPNAMTVTPDSGAHYGNQQTWVGNSLTVYTSNPTGQRDTINARYTLSSDSALGSTTVIDADQAGGNYSATVTYTLTLN